MLPRLRWGNILDHPNRTAGQRDGFTRLSDRFATVTITVTGCD